MYAKVQFQEAWESNMNAKKIVIRKCKLKHVAM